MAHLPFRTIAVSGNSMSPTYIDGDWLLFRRLSGVEMNGAQRLVGKVVVIERESYPGILLIKRVMRADENGLWVEGDNKDASTDSRTWGLLAPREIVGRVLIRYRRS
ncbi:MAG: nickel-type superoxide dismutase maturation protease [Actinomycetes bacterium]